MANKKIDRRNFLKKTAMVTLPIALGGFPLTAYSKKSKSSKEDENDKILVLLQLQGGNDGLATIFHDDQYANLKAVRDNVIVPETSILKFEGKYGFHPSMSGIKGLWENEEMSIIQNVGYPNQNRSHFRSTDIWNSASSAEEFEDRGWIGRFYDLDHGAYPTGYPNGGQPDPFAITMGKIVSETCQGSNANYSLSLLDPENPGTTLVGVAGETRNDCFGDALSFINDTVTQTNAYSKSITDAYEAGNNMSVKWDSLESEIAQKLKHVARLISGGLKTKIYIVQLGGFDTHDNQVVVDDTTTGIHAILLQQLSDSVAAFQDDLNLLNLSERVLGMTYSEFGRRIRSNSALGTDHGTAAPLFMFGKCVKHQILGSHPVISRDAGIDEGVPMEYDFRDIYATVLQDWLGLGETKTRDIIHPEYQAIELFQTSCLSTSSILEVENQIGLSVYPNPARGQVTLKIKGMDTIRRFQLSDTAGSTIQVNHSISPKNGYQVCTIDVRNIPSGTYFILFSDGLLSKVERFVKI